MARLYTLLVAWVVALLGGLFVVAGGVLLSLGGSAYYVIVGLAMVISGALIGRERQSGLWLYGAVWLGTVIWAIWEVGLDGLQLMPRVIAPTVLLFLVLLTRVPKRTGRSFHKAIPAVAGGLAVISVTALTLHGQGVFAQDEALPAFSRVSSGEADADWRDYGGTLSGRRYSALADITPQNVGRLELAWTQRTGDLAMPAEAKAHKREYHSESTPIHIGDTLYT